MDGQNGELISNGALNLRGDFVNLDGANTSAKALNINSKILSSVGGRLIQTGDGDMALVATDKLDNTNGLIATNAANLAIETQNLINKSSGLNEKSEANTAQIQHAGTGAFNLAAKLLDGQNGELISNGVLNLQGEVVNLNGANTSAKSLNTNSKILSNLGGSLIQTGTEAGSITVTEGLNNAQGVLVSNGDLALTVGSLDNTDGTIQAGGLLAQGEGEEPIELLGNLTLTATGLVNNAGGSVSAQGEVTVKAGALNNTAEGRLSAKEALTVTVATLDNTDGQLVAGSDLTVSADALNNTRGVLAAVTGEVGLTTQSLLNNAQGQISGAGKVRISALGVNNVAGLIQGDDVGVNAQGAGFNNTDGKVLSGQDLGLATGELNNTAGLIQGLGAVTIKTNGQALMNTASGVDKGIVAGLDLTLTVGRLNNQTGFIGQQGAGVLTVSANDIDNQNGVLNSAGGLVLNSASLIANQNGQIEALGDSRIKAQTILNQWGLFRSGGWLTVTAANLDNQNTQTVSAPATREADPAPSYGLEGDVLDLVVSDTLNNTGGAMRSSTSLTAKTNTVLNDGGLMSSAGTLDVTATAIHNTAGRLVAGAILVLNTQAYLGVGSALSLGDLSMTIGQDYTHVGLIQGAGHTSLTVQGQLINAGNIESAQDLTVNAYAIDNTASGSLMSGGKTQLNADSLINRGVIDGVQTWIHVGTLTNLGTGVIYGDHIAIKADTLNNQSEHGVTGSIASRGDLDIGVRHLNNRDGSLILSVRDMAIGGTLDDNGRATGQAAKILNSSATIESLGNMTLSSLDIHNQNASFKIEDQLIVENEPRQYIRREGRAIFYALDELHYDVHDVMGELHGSYVPKAYLPTVPKPPGTNPYGGFFGGEPTHLDKPRNPDPDGSLAENCASWPTLNFCGQFQADQAIYEQEQAQYEQEVAAWKADWQVYNADQAEYQSHRFSNWTAYNLNRTETETQVTESAPSQILVGGDLTLKNVGQLLNDQSQLIVGGSLNGDARVIKNVSVTGLHTITEKGTGTYTKVVYDDSFFGGNVDRETDSATEFERVVKSETIPLSISEYKTNTKAPSGEGAGNGELRNEAVSTAKVGDVADDNRQGTGGSGAGLDGLDAAQAGGVDQIHANGTGQFNQAGSDAIQPSGIWQVAQNGTDAVIRTTSPNLSLPTQSIFRKNTAPEARYLVETDPRFTNGRLWSSSDYYLTALGLDPAYSQKRYGDGFYEQRLIREQLGQLTGLRFLDGYQSDEEQYRALMDSGVAYAKAYNLRPGLALSAEQMANLTSDMVWLVEKDVTLADGSVSRVLVPQLYLRAGSMDVQGTGTLISAKNINLKLSGDFTNSGTVLAREGLQIQANNLHNLGGRFSGNDVRLFAEQDINHVGGLIDATNTLVLSAKRDLNLTTTTRSEASQGAGYDLSHTNIDQVAAVVVRGQKVPNVNVAANGATPADPNKIPDGALILSAGRDMNATGAIISNQSAKGITSVQADREVNFKTVTVVEQSDFVQDANNYTKSGYTQEIGTQLSGNGHIVITAGRDVNARAADVYSDNGAVIVDAKHDINLTAGEATMNQSFASQNTERGTFSKSTTTTRDSISATQALGSTFSGNTVSMSAGNDITLIGSNVVATGDVSLMAGNNLTISAATNTYTENHFSESKKSGILGKQNNLSDLTESGATQSQSRSLVGSLTGNVSLVVGNALGVHGSDVFAANNVTLAAQTIDITAGVDVNESHLTQSSKRSTSMPILDNKHNSQDDRFTVTRSGSSISAGNQINLAAGQRILLEGAHLDATTVKVTSLAAEGTSPDLIITGSLGQQQYSHTESSETGHVWQKASGHGSSSQTFEQTTINGQLDIDPKFKIHVQTANPNGTANVETLSTTLQALATSDPGLGYLQDLAQNPNVDWQAVTLAQDQWDYSQSGLTPVGAAILVIAVTVVTAGAAGTATTASVAGVSLSTAVTVGRHDRDVHGGRRGLERRDVSFIGQRVGEFGEQRRQHSRHFKRAGE